MAMVEEAIRERLKEILAQEEQIRFAVLYGSAAISTPHREGEAEWWSLYFRYASV